LRIREAFFWYWRTRLKTYQQGARFAAPLGIVLVANLVGKYLFALCIGQATLLPPQIQQVLFGVDNYVGYTQKSTAGFDVLTVA